MVTAPNTTLTITSTNCACAAPTLSTTPLCAAACRFVAREATLPASRDDCIRSATQGESMIWALPTMTAASTTSCAPSSYPTSRDHPRAAEVAAAITETLMIWPALAAADYMPHAEVLPRTATLISVVMILHPSCRRIPRAIAPPCT